MNNKNNQKSIRTIETNGVEQIPDHERTASPKDLFRLVFGGANTFATAVLGSFPVLFGLSFLKLQKHCLADYARYWHFTDLIWLMIFPSLYIIR